MKGIVFAFEEFSVYDGPGIRTTVFLKGCPLKCTWCHNPEGQTTAPQIVRSPNGCVSCNNCIKFAEEKNGEYTFTTESIKKCPMNLLRVCGEITESAELCEKILKNINILKNGGGVTFSGGEPLTQHEFLFECLSNLKGKIHTAIQTSGFCREEIFAQALSLSDYFLYDLKLIDDEKHMEYTGVSNEKILRNFSSLAKSGKTFVVRIPLIPGVTDTRENIKAVAEVMCANEVFYAEVLPYNKMAGGKYKMLLREYNPGFDEKKAVCLHEDVFRQYGIKIKVM